MNQRIYHGRRAGMKPEVFVLETDGQARMLHPDRSLCRRCISASGFDWGYCGPAPAQLAFAVLLDYYHRDFGQDVGLNSFICFRQQVVEFMPVEGWELAGGEIQFWMQTNMDNRPQDALNYFTAKWDGAEKQAK